MALTIIRKETAIIGKDGDDVLWFSSVSQLTLLLELTGWHIRAVSLAVALSTTWVGCPACSGVPNIAWHLTTTTTPFGENSERSADRLLSGQREIRADHPQRAGLEVLAS